MGGKPFQLTIGFTISKRMPVLLISLFTLLMFAIILKSLDSISEGDALRGAPLFICRKWFFDEAAGGRAVITNAPVKNL
jgi:hypothetical protein